MSTVTFSKKLKKLSPVTNRNLTKKGSIAEIGVTIATGIKTCFMNV